MASILKVDKLDPQGGTALEIGTSGDTISIPSGATLDISASTLTPPATMPASSGINLTALNATNLGSGTVPTARLGTGTASGSTILYGDNTWAAAAGGGKILQVKVASNSSGYSGTSSSWTDATDFNVTITPASTDNHILIGINPGKLSFSSYYGFFSAKRDISGGAATDNFVGDSYGFYWGEGPHPSGYFPTFGFAVDAPSTTSAITYTAQFRNSNNSSTVSFGSTSSQNCIFAIEVDGSTA